MTSAIQKPNPKSRYMKLRNGMDGTGVTVSSAMDTDDVTQPSSMYILRR